MLAGYGLEVDQLARVNDVLAKASSSANTDVLQLGQAFKYAGPVASSAGISFEQSGAAMALMGNAGIQAEMAGTALRGAITKLVNPSGEAAAAIADLEISVTDATGRLLPFDQIIEQLEPHAHKTGKIMQIFGQRAGPAMSALISQGADALREMTTALEQSGGTAQEIADKKLAGLTGAWTKLKSATEGVFIEIGTRLSPVLERLAALLTDRVLPAVRGALEAFDRLSPRIKTAAVVGAGLAAALGPVLIATGGMVSVITPLLPIMAKFGLLTKLGAVAVGVLKTAFAVLTGPIGLTVAAVIAFLASTQEGRAVLSATGKLIKEVVVFAFNQLRDVLVWAGEQLVVFGKWLSDLIMKIPGLSRLIDWLAKKAGAAGDAMGRMNDQADTRRLREEVQAAADRFTEIGQEAKAVEDRLRGFGKRIMLNPAAFREMSARAAEMRAEVDRLGTGAPASLKRLEAALDTTRKEMGLTAQSATDTGAAVAEVRKEVAGITEETGAEIGALDVQPVTEFGEAVGDAAKDAQALIDTWTGASLTSKDLILAFEALTTAQLGNERVMTQVLDAYASMRTVLGPFHAELEQLWQTHERLKTPLQSNTDLTNRLMRAQVAATQAQAALNERLDAHRRALLHLPTDHAITAFKELRTVWDTLSESERADATEAYSTALQQAAESGMRLTAEEAALVGQAAGRNWATSFFGTLASAFEGGGGFAGGIKSLFSQGLGQIFSSMTGGEGGGLTGALGTIFSGDGVLGKIGSWGTKIGGGIGKFLSLGLNGVPIVGPFLAAFSGPLLKGVGKLFKKMFGGPSEAELAGRKTAGAFRDSVIQTLTDGQLAEASKAALGAWRGNEQGAQFLIGVRDAYLAVGRSAGEAEAMVTRLWQAEARGPAAVQAVQRELQVVLDQAADLTARNRMIVQGLESIRDAGPAAFDPVQLDPYLAQMQELGLVTADEAAALRQMADDAHVDWRAMEESAKHYGVAMKTVVDEAGHEVQVFDESLLGLGHAQAKLTDEAGQLASAWSLLTGEGTNTQVAIEGMTDEAQGFVTKALEMGVALPEAMRPMLDAMVAQGRLTDENGDKLTDLSGLTFAAPIAEGFDLLADKIQLLIITLGGPSGLSKAVEDMAASARLDIKGLAGEWAGMTDAMQTEFGSFAAFVEDQALRDLTAEAGLNYDAIAARWKDMTDVQKAAFGSFREFLRDHELTQLATDAGRTFDDLEQQWTDMTDAQRTETESFRAFVNRELDKIEDKTVTVTTQYRTEGAPAAGDGATTYGGAQHGTPFRHFGAGTPMILHGLERVMTAGEGRGIHAALGRITGGLAAIADLSGVRALAEGGLVTRPTLATFAEHGPEVAIPLERLDEFGGGRRVEAKLDQLHQDFALLIDEFRHGLDPRRRERAAVAAAALSTA